jgi:hypothetical protein
MNDSSKLDFGFCSYSLPLEGGDLRYLVPNVFGTTRIPISIHERE